MSDYGPPTNEQIRQYRGSQARTANWVDKHASSRPASSRQNSSDSYSSSRASSRATSRRSSLPPPPPGFKYAPANQPIVFKTQAATYTVVPGSSKSITVNAGSSGRPQISTRHSSSSSRQVSVPVVRSPSTPYETSSVSYHPTFAFPVKPSPPKPKEKPLLRRLFGIGPAPKKEQHRSRRHSTGGSSGGKGITIVW